MEFGLAKPTLEANGVISKKNRTKISVTFFITIY